MGAHITNISIDFLVEGILQENLICIFRCIFRPSTRKINEDV